MLSSVDPRYEEVEARNAYCLLFLYFRTIIDHSLTTIQSLFIISLIHIIPWSRDASPVPVAFDEAEGHQNKKQKLSDSVATTTAKDTGPHEADGEGFTDKDDEDYVNDEFFWSSMRDMLLEFVEDINHGVLKVIVSHLPQNIRDSKTKGYTQKRDRDGKLIEKYSSSITYKGVCRNIKVVNNPDTATAYYKIAKYFHQEQKLPTIPRGGVLPIVDSKNDIVASQDAKSSAKLNMSLLTKKKLWNTAFQLVSPSVTAHGGVLPIVDSTNDIATASKYFHQEQKLPTIPRGGVLPIVDSTNDTVASQDPKSSAKTEHVATTDEARKVAARALVELESVYARTFTTRVLTTPSTTVTVAVTPSPPRPSMNASSAVKPQPHYEIYLGC